MRESCEIWQQEAVEVGDLRGLFWRERERELRDIAAVSHRSRRPERTVLERGAGRSIRVYSER